MKFKEFLKTAFLLIVFVSFVFWPSCGKIKSPIEPVETELINGDASADTQAKKAKKIRNESGWTLEETVNLEDAKKVYVVMQAGDVFRFTALVKSIIPPTQDMSRIKITIQASLDETTFSREAIIFKFAPDGLLFSPPAELSIRANVLGRLLDRQKFSLYYFDENQARWVKRETITTLWSNKSKETEKEILVEIPHFSLWAISKD